MPHSPLYQKILAEAANDRTAGRARTFAGTAPSRVSNVPVRHAPVIPAERLRELPLHEIAQHIERDWPNVNYAARPYLDALKECDGNGATFGPARESAKTLALYFLSNATPWHGENARLVKAELRRRFR